MEKIKTVANFLATVSDNMPSDIADGSIINWINVLEDMVYREIIKDLKLDKDKEIIKPELKTQEKAETQTLDLLQYGEKWLQLYEYYVYAQIALLKEEFGKYNNYAILFDSHYNDFAAYYYSNCYNPIREQRKGEFR